MEKTNKESKKKISKFIFYDLDEMTIRLQTLDDCLTISINRIATVLELKEKIKEVMLIYLHE
jgi:hypothetical protein